MRAPSKKGLGKWALGGVALAVVAFGGVSLFKRQIGTALLERAVDQRVGRDSTAGRPRG